MSLCYELTSDLDAAEDMETISFCGVEDITPCSESIYIANVKIRKELIPKRKNN